MDFAPCIESCLAEIRCVYPSVGASHHSPSIWAVSSTHSCAIAHIAVRESHWNTTCIRIFVSVNKAHCPLQEIAISPST